MSDDKTIISPRYNQNRENADHTVMLQPGLKVSLFDVNGSVLKVFTFTSDFSVGRSSENDIAIPIKAVSRHHLVIKKEQGWWIHDLDSANGTYINDEQVVQKAHLNLPVSVSLGKAGISLKIEFLRQVSGDGCQTHISSEISLPGATVQIKDSIRDHSKDELKARLLARSESEDLGDHTRMIRSIIHEDRMVHGKKHRKFIWVLTALFLISIVFIIYQQVTISNARTLAVDMFYDIKVLEVSLSQSEIRLAESAEVMDLTINAILSKKLEVDQKIIEVEQERIIVERQRVAQQRKMLEGMKVRYQQYVKKAQSYRLGFSSSKHYEEDLIARVARGFGESELELPEDFLNEVNRYISLWQQSSRMQQAMARLEAHGYTPIIMNALENEGLPIYFAYLPLQESDYDPNAIGPQTRFGVAKGAWQFLATTGQEYGLSPGPLENVREYDELDERFDFVLATHAGAKYLKKIYSTEAQASGLLVLASYNYGQTRVRRMINKMEDDPRERNFWKLIQQFDIPKETYDYVFYIFAAAVIGEDPLHFGFGFEPPFYSSDLRQ